MANVVTYNFFFFFRLMGIKEEGASPVTMIFPLAWDGPMREHHVRLSVCNEVGGDPLVGYGPYHHESSKSWGSSEPSKLHRWWWYIWCLPYVWRLDECWVVIRGIASPLIMDPTDLFFLFSSPSTFLLNKTI